ncbi:hypothetical protein U1Q18_002994 [Sarracenia purpurea var. burkii]
MESHHSKNAHCPIRRSVAKIDGPSHMSSPSQLHKVKLFGDAEASERENIYISLDQRHSLSENIVKTCRAGCGENILYVELRWSSPFLRSVTGHQDKEPKNSHQGNREENHGF